MSVNKLFIFSNVVKTACRDFVTFGSVIIPKQTNNVHSQSGYFLFSENKKELSALLKEDSNIFRMLSLLSLAIGGVGSVPQNKFLAEIISRIFWLPMQSPPYVQVDWHLNAPKDFNVCNSTRPFKSNWVARFLWLCKGESSTEFSTSFGNGWSSRVEIAIKAATLANMTTLTLNDWKLTKVFYFYF